MKEISKYSRLAMYLEKLYDKLNHDFFEDSLERPVITVQSTARAYGHYTLYDAWSIKGEGYRELNIDSTVRLRTCLRRFCMRCAICYNIYIKIHETTVYTFHIQTFHISPKIPSFPAHLPHSTQEKRRNGFPFPPGCVEQNNFFRIRRTAYLQRRETNYSTISKV